MAGRGKHIEKISLPFYSSNNGEMENGDVIEPFPLGFSTAF